MWFVFMNHRVLIGRKQLLFGFGLLVAWLTLVSSHFDPIVAILLLGIIFLTLRFTTKPFSLFIARLRFSIRWKLEIGVAAIAVLFLIISLIQTRAMNYMHEELHGILDAGADPTSEVLAAVDTLENTQHGPFYRLLPFLGILGVLGAAAIGSSMARSVIDPIRKTGEGMRRIASGDFSEPVYVTNRDELGELAGRVNDTAQDLARLQEATLAEERARALRERIIQVTSAQEEERRRISRDLHDGLGPSLASIGNQLRACQSLVDTDPHRAKNELDEIAKGMKVHVQEVRDLIHDLRPLALDQLGLAGAVAQEVSRFGHESGLAASFSKSEEITLNPFAEVTVFRVVQECLTNVQRHANASEVAVRLQASESGLRATIKDNGSGFDTENINSASRKVGMGLLRMRERAELLGGSLTIHSTPNEGCEIALVIPITEVPVGAYPSASGG